MFAMLPFETKITNQNRELTPPFHFHNFFFHFVASHFCSVFKVYLLFFPNIASTGYAQISYSMFHISDMKRKLKSRNKKKNIENGRQLAVFNQIFTYPLAQNLF